MNFFRFNHYPYMKPTISIDDIYYCSTKYEIHEINILEIKDVKVLVLHEDLDKPLLMLSRFNQLDIVVA